MLANAAIDALPSELEAALGSKQAAVAWWRDFMWDKAVEDRAEAVAVLVAWMEGEIGLSFVDRLKTALRTYVAGNREQALQLLAGESAARAARSVQRQYCRNCAAWHDVGDQSALWELLSEWNPSMALRALRKTRPWGTRVDADEQGTRRVALVRLLRRLGRQKLAASLEK